MQKTPAEIVTAKRFAVTIVLCFLVGARAGAAEYRQPSVQQARPEPKALAAPRGSVPVHLYFGSPNGSYLISEARLIGESEDPVQVAGAILEALISGPRSDLTRTLPAAARLRALFITTDNICIVDFGPAIRDSHPGGCRGEMLTVYSIVNSLIINIPSIRQVKLLIEGNDIDTLTGHMNMQHPIPANMLIIR